MPSGLTSEVLGPAKEMNAVAGLADGLIIRVFAALGSDGNVSYWFIGPPSDPDFTFPVKVQQTGGSQGTGTTPASYTYTVRTLAWNGTSGGETLGTGVAQSRPRPNGRVTFQAGSTGYGVAFYDGSTLRLWDAGEIPITNECT
jgi:hypothetical protein